MVDFFKKKQLADEDIQIQELNSIDVEKSKDKIDTVAALSSDIIETGSLKSTTAEKYNHEVRYPLESYLYYAILDRRREWEDKKKTAVDRMLAKIDIDDSEHEKRVPEDAVPPRDNSEMILRMANWWSVFFLITSDILGPNSAPYANFRLR